MFILIVNFHEQTYIKIVIYSVYKKKILMYNAVCIDRPKNALYVISVPNLSRVTHMFL